MFGGVILRTEKPNEKDDIGLGMLAATHNLFTSDRIADEQELIISTCVEVLKDGPISPNQVHGRVNNIWPGSHISIDKLTASLENGSKLDIFAKQNTSEGQNWALGQSGVAEATMTRDWFADIMDRLSSQIQERAAKDFGVISRVQSKLWAKILLKLFTVEISKRNGSFTGAVEKGPTGRVHPISLDAAAMLEAIGKMEMNQSTKDFLGGCLLAAVDEAEFFGNEIVSCVATSCVLHAVIAGRLSSSAREHLGGLDGQRVVIDTPILVKYLGPKNSVGNLKKVVNLAVAAKMEVIVPRHVLQELFDLVDRIERQCIPGLLRALSQGTKARIYAQTVDEDILSMFLDATEERKYSNWSDFAKRAKNLEAELVAMGVVVRDHGNVDRNRVRSCSVQLEAEIRTSLKPRGATSIARDAESMELVWRSRRKYRLKDPMVWPGGWIVTYDRRIDPAYRKIEPKDANRLVLTPAQWAAILAETESTVDIKQIVGAAADFVLEETMLRVAVKYPPAVALELARTLSSETMSDTDIRVAQMAFDQIQDHPDGVNSASSERVLAIVNRKHIDRMAGAAIVHREEAIASRAQMDEKQSAQEALLKSSLDNQNEMNNRYSNLERKFEDHRADSQKEIERLKSIHKQEKVLQIRLATSIGVTVMLLMSALFLFSTDHIRWCMLLIIGTSIFFAKSYEWFTNIEKRATPLLMAGIPGFIGLLMDHWHFWR